MPWYHHDVTAATGAPANAGRLTGFFDQSNTVQHVFYQGLDGHIHELWWDARGWHYHNITAEIGAPANAADAELTSYFHESQTVQHVFYRGADKHIHELFWDRSGGWRHFDPTAAARAPANAVRDLTCYLDESQIVQHVFWVGADDSIHELMWDRLGGWQHFDPTAVSLAPAASRGVTGFFDERHRAQHVFYRGKDRHIHELWWAESSGWRHHDVTAATRAGPAFGDVTSLLDRRHTVMHVFYIGKDHHLHELWWDAAGWHHHNLNVVVRQPLYVRGDLTCFMDERNTVMHVFFVDWHPNRSGGQVYEFWWDAAGWHYNNLSSEAGAPANAIDPLTSFFDERNGVQHVFYTGRDRHIHELWWKP